MGFSQEKRLSKQTNKNGTLIHPLSLALERLLFDFLFILHLFADPKQNDSHRVPHRTLPPRCLSACMASLCSATLSPSTHVERKSDRKRRTFWPTFFPPELSSDGQISIHILRNAERWGCFFSRFPLPSRSNNKPPPPLAKRNKILSQCLNPEKGVYVVGWVAKNRTQFYPFANFAPSQRGRGGTRPDDSS